MPEIDKSQNKFTKKTINFAKKNSDYVFNLFLFFYLILGFYLSANTGISMDELADQYIGETNVEAIKYFFGYNENGYLNLLEFQDKFHGAGFQYISQIYILIASIIVKLEKFSEETSKILLSHNLIFFTFFLSGIFAKKIVNLLIKDKLYSNIFLIFYLFYPYLLGHGFYNQKDMPFLFAWILSTYISIRIFLKIYENENVPFLNFFFLSLSTSFLISIRIPGILILLQYLITFIITSSLLRDPFYKILKIYFYKIFLFLCFTLLLSILCYPIFWKNPLIIFDAINTIRDYPLGVCTLTLGKCMEATKLPYNYIFIWLFFKLPILSLIGLMLFPFAERKIFSQPTRQIILGSILLTLISIILILIFLEANIYDELRHVLYIVPLILIISFSITYFFSKKLLLYVAFLSIFSFSIQNINMYPYQYTWFNLFSNFININSNFELDYWGVSGRNIAEKINNNDQLLHYRDKCIYVPLPKHIIEPFISTDFNCIKPSLSIYPKSTEKYILVKYTRLIRRENPSNCKLIIEESYNLNLFKDKLIMGKVFICN